jgi:hypothetical protein
MRGGNELGDNAKTARLSCGEYTCNMLPALVWEIGSWNELLCRIMHKVYSPLRTLFYERLAYV